MKIRIFTVAALAAVVLLPGSTGRAASEGVLAIVWQGYDLQLARLAPASLEPLGDQNVALGRIVRPGSGRSAYTWAFSPNASQIAVGGRMLGGLRIADLSTMRIRTRMGLWAEPLAWLAPRRLLAGEQSDLDVAPDRLVLIDPVARRVLARRRLGGSIVRTATTGDRLVLLLAPSGKIGRARIAVADSGGKVRSSVLAWIPAGNAVDQRSHAGRFEDPALALDPAGRRAFVVGALPVVAEVDVRTTAVRYHELGRAMLKLAAGSSRSARWLGDGLFAVAGYDDRGFTDARGDQQQLSTPAGLRLVDTRTWTARTVETRAAFFTVAEGTLLTYGSSWRSDTDTRTGMGVAAYTRGGDLRFRVFGDEPVGWVQATGGYAYVARDQFTTTAVVDLSSGRVTSVLGRPMPVLLVPGQSPY